MSDVRKLFSEISSKRAAAAELEDRIREQYTALIPRTMRYDIEHKRSGSSSYDRVERILDHVEKIKVRQQDIVEGYLSDIELAYTVIKRMDNPTEARMLSLKYLSNESMGWEDVANALHYSSRWVYLNREVALTHAQTVLDSINAEQGSESREYSESGSEMLSSYSGENAAAGGQ